MINFAHSEVFMIGAFLGCGALVLLSGFPSGWALAAAFMIAMIGCGVLAVAIEKVAYVPLRQAPRLAPLISAIGVSIVIQNAVFLWRNDFVGFPNVFPNELINFGVTEI